MSDFKDQEFCICAAIQLPDGKVIVGHRHIDAMRTLFDVVGSAAAENILMANGVLDSHGFLTSRNRFVSRGEGRRLQLEAGRASASPDGYRSKIELYSDDLY